MLIETYYHWLVGPGDIRLERERFDPDNIADDEVLCRTVVSAISPGTELAAFEGLEPLRPNVPAYPRWLGYMNVGEVVRAGRNAAADYPEGARIYSHAAHRGHFRLDKGNILAAVPEGLDVTPASLSYLYRLAWVGLRRGRVEADRSIAIVGLGAIGQCAVELAARFGGRVLGVSDHGNARLAVQPFNADAIGRDEAEKRFVREVPNENGRFDLVLVTTNGWRDWQIALSLTRFGGIVSVLGFPGRGEARPEVNPLLPTLFYDRQLTIMSAGIAGSGAGEGRESPSLAKRDMAQILDWINTGHIDASRLCMGTHPARDLTGAYRRLKAAGRGIGTLVLDWTDA